MGFDILAPFTEIINFYFRQAWGIGQIASIIIGIGIGYLMIRSDKEKEKEEDIKKKWK